MDANKKSCTTPFINNLEIIEIFKDEAKEEEASVVELKELVDIARAIIEPIKLCDEEW